MVGTSGSGKTTFASRLAKVRRVAHIELDELHWEENWTEAPDDVFLQRVETATAADFWVVDGNYSAARPVVWKRADALVWLDYDLSVIMRQLLWRTVTRAARRVELWKGNRESFYMSFMTKDSVLWWALTTYKRRRREYSALIASSEFAHLTVFHLKNPGEAENFLAETAAALGGTTEL